jgi:hypothetical protein
MYSRLCCEWISAELTAHMYMYWYTSQLQWQQDAVFMQAHRDATNS